jgi:putative ABC transport system substrate-binding protein
VIPRRSFITLLGGAVASWPMVALGQQGERMRRIGVLNSLTESDTQDRARMGAFRQGLKEWGWVDGRNLQTDIRWAAGDADRARRYAADLVALNPEVILVMSSVFVAALQSATRTIPIVFAGVVDPVGAGLVGSMARPGGNTTGFVLFEYSMSGKWLEILKEIEPRTTRVAILRDPSVAAGGGQLGALQSAAPSFGVEVRPIDVRDAAAIERDITAFARGANGGIIVTGSAPAVVHRDLIISLAARHRLPAVYPYSYYVTGGGLISYGPEQLDPYRRAAAYVDRILKGEKPADLPVEAPTKFELTINLKTAKTLGLTVSPALLSRADEVIE